MRVTLDTDRLKGPVWPTYLILSLGAALGAAVGGAFGLATTSSLAMVSGPFGMVMTAPALATQTTLTIVGVALVPFLATIAGMVFAERGSGKNAIAALGVTLLPDDHGLVQRVQELAEQLALPPIKWVGWFDETEINAFAYGTRQEEALLAFSRGCFDKLGREAFEAIIGHELGHVANNDMARMTHARAIQEGLTWFLVFRGLKTFARAVFTPLSELELLRFSRAREYRADAIGAILASPEAMIAVLEGFQHDDAAPAPTRKGHANVMIRPNVGALFSTHPSTERRIEALRSGRYTRLLPSLHARSAMTASSETA